MDLKLGFKMNGRPVDFKHALGMMTKVPKEKFDQVFGEMVDIGNDVRNRIITSMRNTQKGTSGYKRGAKMHYPSKPGSPPAIDRGELVANIMASINNTRKTVEVGALRRVKYAGYLEDGTKKMKPRPWLAPAYEAENVTQRIMQAHSRSVE